MILTMMNPAIGLPCIPGSFPLKQEEAANHLADNVDSYHGFASGLFRMINQIADLYRFQNEYSINASRIQRLQ